MEYVQLESDLRPLSLTEMMEIDAGFPWAAVAAGLAVNFIVNIPDFVNGLVAGWNAYH